MGRGRYDGFAILFSAIIHFGKKIGIDENNASQPHHGLPSQCVLLTNATGWKDSAKDARSTADTFTCTGNEYNSVYGIDDMISKVVWCQLENRQRMKLKKWIMHNLFDL